MRLVEPDKGARTVDVRGGEVQVEVFRDGLRSALHGGCLGRQLVQVLSARQKRVSVEVLQVVQPSSRAVVDVDSLVPPTRGGRRMGSLRMAAHAANAVEREAPYGVNQWHRGRSRRGARRRLAAPRSIQTTCSFTRRGWTGVATTHTATVTRVSPHPFSSIR